MIGSQALVDHVAEAGLRIVNGTEFATRADVVVVGRPRALRLRELRTATQAVLRGAELIGLTPRPHVPDARRPLAGHRRRSSRRSRPPPGARRTRSSASPSRRCTRPPATASARARSLAVGDRLDVDVLGAKRAGLDTALVLTGVTDRAQAGGAQPAPTHVADSLAALLLTS